MRLREFFARRLNGLRGALGFEDLKETVDQRWRLEHRFHEQKATARVGVVGYSKEGLTEIGVTAEALGPSDEPEVELVLCGAKVGDKLGVVALGIVDQVAGVDLEELRQEQSGGVGEMGASSAFDLRKVGLTNGGLAVGCPRIGLDGADQLLLGHSTIEAAEIALDFAEIPDFVAELHGSYCRSQYLYRNL